MRTSFSLLMLLLASCSASGPDGVSDAGTDPDANLQDGAIADAPADDGELDSHRPRPDVADVTIDVADVALDGPEPLDLGVVTFELGQVDTDQVYSAVVDQGLLTAVQGPQGGFHIELIARLEGGVSEADVRETEIRVALTDAEGMEIGLGYWLIDRTLWDEDAAGYSTKLPPLFLYIEPMGGEQVHLEAFAGRSASIGTLSYDLELTL